jgi:hypothetical protein
MELTPVVSTNVSAVGYEPATRRMRVLFASGGLYEYQDVDQALFEEMLLPYPWRRVGKLVLAHPCTRVR